jgi:hypothetical protein
MASGREREVFAKTMIALQPYASEIVLIGGWVHALYVAEARVAVRPVYTTDIDITIPPTLLMGDRPSLIDLVQVAGFELDELDSASGLKSFWQPGDRQQVIDLDLLTEASSIREAVVIEGQPDLVVPGYPNQRILLENARWIEVGSDVHPILDPPCRIRVPTLPAYALVKVLSSDRRPSLGKRAKDLVYLFEIVRDRSMGEQVLAGLGALCVQYPDEFRCWRKILHRVSDDPAVLDGIAVQLSVGSRAFGTSREIARHVAGRFRRLLAETASLQ